MRSGRTGKHVAGLGIAVEDTGRKLFTASQTHALKSCPHLSSRNVRLPTGQLKTVEDCVNVVKADPAERVAELLANERRSRTPRRREPFDDPVCGRLKVEQLADVHPGRLHVDQRQLIGNLGNERGQLLVMHRKGLPAIVAPVTRRGLRTYADLPGPLGNA